MGVGPTKDMGQGQSDEGTKDTEEPKVGQIKDTEEPKVGQIDYHRDFKTIDVNGRKMVCNMTQIPHPIDPKGSYGATLTCLYKPDDGGWVAPPQQCKWRKDIYQR